MKKLPLLLLALLVLAACAPAPAKETSDVSQTSEVLPTPTKTPTPSIIETPRPTATATALKKTETPSPTATKEAPMTLDNWYKVLYNGTFVHPVTGENIPLEIAFGPTETKILTTSEEIMSLSPKQPFIVLHPDGLMTTPASQEYAVEQLKNGAYVMTNNDKISNTSFYVKYALIASSNATREGNTKIRFEFGRYTSTVSNTEPSTFSLDVIYTVNKDGKMIAPQVLNMPGRFEVSLDGEIFSSFIVPSGSEPLDNTNWLDYLLKAGYTWIKVWAQ